MRKPANPDCPHCHGAGVVEVRQYLNDLLFCLHWEPCACTFRPLPPSEVNPYDDDPPAAA